MYLKTLDPVQQFAIKAAEVAGHIICIDKKEIYCRWSKSHYMIIFDLILPLLKISFSWNSLLSWPSLHKRWSFQIRISSHLLKKPSVENFCAVLAPCHLQYFGHSFVSLFLILTWGSWNQIGNTFVSLLSVMNYFLKKNWF